MGGTVDIDRSLLLYFVRTEGTVNSTIGRSVLFFTFLFTPDERSIILSTVLSYSFCLAREERPIALSTVRNTYFISFIDANLILLSPNSPPHPTSTRPPSLPLRYLSLPPPFAQQYSYSHLILHYDATSLITAANRYLVVPPGIALAASTHVGYDGLVELDRTCGERGRWRRHHHRYRIDVSHLF
jgi:hypothetical protein